MNFAKIPIFPWNFPNYSFVGGKLLTRYTVSWKVGASFESWMRKSFLCIMHVWHGYHLVKTREIILYICSLTLPIFIRRIIIYYQGSTCRLHQENIRVYDWTYFERTGFMPHIQTSPIARNSTWSERKQSLIHHFERRRRLVLNSTEWEGGGIKSSRDLLHRVLFPATVAIIWNPGLHELTSFL